MVTGSLTIGVMALQGAFAKHIQMVQSLGAQTIEVRRPADLDKCDALIIPGGESTTMLKQMRFIGMESPLREFSKHKPVFGTCAGLILLATEIVDRSIEPFCLLDITVERNAFGSQTESFLADVDVGVSAFNKGKLCTLLAMFIRAPRIRSVTSHCQVLATYQGEPVLVQQGNHLASTFHPELTSDSTIHAYFLRLVDKETVRLRKQQQV